MCQPTPKEKAMIGFLIFVIVSKRYCDSGMFVKWLQSGKLITRLASGIGVCKIIVSPPRPKGFRIFAAIPGASDSFYLSRVRRALYLRYLACTMVMCHARTLPN